MFFVQLRLCNQRLLRSLRLRSVHNGGHRQLQNVKLVVCRFSLRNGLTPPVQSKIASLISLALNSQRRMGYGFALSAEALLRRHGLTHLMERECSQSAHKCTIAPYSRSTPAHLHPTLSLDILRSRCLRCLVQRSHLLLLLRLLLSLRIHCSRGHGFLHRFLLCFLMYRDT